MPEPITEREQRVLEWITEYVTRNAYAPSIREIGAALSIPSTRSVSELLQSLEGKGRIERSPSRSRGLRVIGLTKAGSARAAVFGPARADDARWMERALEQARAAQRAEEVPVGAVLVRNGVVLAEAGNLTRTLSDPTAHAEMVVLRTATTRERTDRLIDTVLYVTLEPCAMCAGAIVLAKVGRLVFAAADPKTGMCGSLGTIVQDPRLNHYVDVTRGVGEVEASQLLRSFFRARR